MKRTFVLSLVATSVVFTIWSGCGSSGDDAKFNQGHPADSGNADVTIDGAKGGAAGEAGGAGQSGGGGDSGQTGQGGQGGGTGGSLADVSIPDVDFSYDAPDDVQQEACATANVEAKLKPLDMYFMIDRSGSMAGTPWNQQAAALSAFWTDVGSTGITAALRFFPLTNDCGNGDICAGNLYLTPLPPGWGLLPGHATALNALVTASGTMGCTPTQDALNGVLKGAKQRQIQVPSHVAVAVMVSDGAPCCGDCLVEDAGGLQAIAQSYYNSSPSIRTFTLFVASSATAVMTAIAQGGGTTQSYDATNTQNFINALKAIQGTAIPCDFDMPKPDAGIVNPDQVTLTYGGVPINKIDNATQCAGNGGWYFDNNASPSKIILCPATCNTIKADPNAKIDVSLGCLGS